MKIHSHTQPGNNIHTNTHIHTESLGNSKNGYSSPRKCFIVTDHQFESYSRILANCIKYTYHIFSCCRQAGRQAVATRLVNL